MSLKAETISGKNETNKAALRTESEQGTALSDMKQIPLSDFLQRFRENSAHFISSAYLMSTREEIRTSTIDGSMYTSLSEDVFTLVEAQLSLVDEFLRATNLSATESGDAVVADAFLSIFRIIRWKQAHYGCTPLFLRDAASSAARANDFCRMGEKTKDMMQSFSEQRYTFLGSKNRESPGEVQGSQEWDITSTLIRQEASKLIDQLNFDSVKASQHAAVYIIQTIQKRDIPSELFGKHWEEDLTNNEVAKYIVRVCADQLSEMKISLVSNYLYQKVVVTLTRCIICYYIKSFILRAHRMKYTYRYYYRFNKDKRKSKSFFRSPKKALLRMAYDIEVFQDFFLELSEGSVALARIISHEFSIIGQILLECSSCILRDNNNESLEQLIIVIHKRTGGDPEITRHLISDIFAMMSGRRSEHYARHKVENMRKDLVKLKGIIETRVSASNCLDGNMNSEYFHLDEMLRDVYGDKILQEKMSICSRLGIEIL